MLDSGFLLSGRNSDQTSDSFWYCQTSLIVTEWDSKAVHSLKICPRTSPIMNNYIFVAANFGDTLDISSGWNIFLSSDVRFPTISNKQLSISSSWSCLLSSLLSPNSFKKPSNYKIIVVKLSAFMYCEDHGSTISNAVRNRNRLNHLPAGNSPNLYVSNHVAVTGTRAAFTHTSPPSNRWYYVYILVQLGKFDSFYDQLLIMIIFDHPKQNFFFATNEFYSHISTMVMSVSWNHYHREDHKHHPLSSWVVIFFQKWTVFILNIL